MSKSRIFGFHAWSFDAMEFVVVVAVARLDVARVVPVLVTVVDVAVVVADGAVVSRRRWLWRQLSCWFNTNSSSIMMTGRKGDQGLECLP